MKLLLLDLDGTIREPLIGEKFMQHSRDQRIMDGADKALAYYSEKGWRIIGISNQAGVEAGYKSLDAAIEEQQYTLYLFPQLETIYFCPDFAGHKCVRVCRSVIEQIRAIFLPSNQLQMDETPYFPESTNFSFRKPGDGMLRIAVEALSGQSFKDFMGKSNSEAECWFIGDREEDLVAAEAAGLNFLDAEIWRNRFRPGIHSLAVNPQQLKFLEGIAL